MSLPDCPEEIRQLLVSFFEKGSSVAIVVVDSQLAVNDCNSGFLKLFSLDRKPVGRSLGDFLLLTNSEGLTPGADWKVQCNPKSGESGVLSGHVIAFQDKMIVVAEKLMLTDTSIVEQMTLLTNELVNKERELVKKNRKLSALQIELTSKISELEATLARVKQLEGIIPICMYCKKIRDDKDSWQQLEQYISDNSEALFSHGICPDCLQHEFAQIMNN